MVRDSGSRAYGVFAWIVIICIATCNLRQSAVAMDFQSDGGAFGMSDMGSTGGFQDPGMTGQSFSASPPMGGGTGGDIVSKVNNIVDGLLNAGGIGGGGMGAGGMGGGIGGGMVGSGNSFSMQSGDSAQNVSQQIEQMRNDIASIKQSIENQSNKTASGSEETPGDDSSHRRHSQNPEDESENNNFDSSKSHKRKNARHSSNHGDSEDDESVTGKKHSQKSHKTKRGIPEHKNAKSTKKSSGGHKKHRRRHKANSKWQRTMPMIYTVKNIDTRGMRSSYLDRIKSSRGARFGGGGSYKIKSYGKLGAHVDDSNHALTYEMKKYSSDSAPISDQKHTVKKSEYFGSMDGCARTSSCQKAPSMRM